MEEEKKNEQENERQSANWDISNAPKNYLSLVLTQGITAFFSFACVWLITKYIGSDGYGGIVAIIAASQVIQIFINWSSTALIRFGVEEFVETGKITKSFWSRSLIFFPNLILVLISSYFWLSPLAVWLKISLSATWLVVFHLITTTIWLHFQYALQGAKMLRLQGVMLAVERVLTFIVLLMLVIVNKISDEFFLLSYILPSLLMSIASCFFLRKFVEFEDFFYIETIQKMFVFSLPLIFFTLIGYLSTSQLDALFINQILSKNDLGIYSVATQISGLTLQLPILANGILLSMFVSLKTGGKDSTVAAFSRNIIPSLTLIWGLFCASLALIFSVVIPIVFGSEFAASSQPLWILLAASTMTFPILIGLAALSNTYSKTYISMIASIFAALTNMILNILLIPRFGLIGCAWATFVSGFISLVIFYLLLRRENLLEKNWIFVAVFPAIGGAGIISADLGVFGALGTCLVMTFVISFLQIKSLRKTILIVKENFNAKNVS